MGGWQTRNVNVFFDSERNSMKRTELDTTLYSLVCIICHSQCVISQHTNYRIDMRIYLRDAIKMCLHHFPTTDSSVSNVSG